MGAAGRAEQEFGAEINVIRKASNEYLQDKDPPPCPSVMVNGTLIARNDTITYEALKRALVDEKA